MKKEDIVSGIIYLILVAAAIIVGLSVLKPAFNELYPQKFMNPYLFAICTIVLGIIINVVGLEVGHIIGAKIGGYKVMSVNILGFCFEKKLNKWSFRFSDFDGLTGETKVGPKSEKTNLKYYVWIPLFMYAIEFALGIVIYSMAQKTTVPNSPLKWMAVGGLLFIIISSMIALYNIVPLHLDTTTDGYRLMILSKPENAEALNELLRIQILESEGKELTDLKVFNKITDFTASVNLYSFYECLKDKDFNRAEEIIDLILASPEKIKEENLYKILAQKAYVMLLNQNTKDVKEYYEENFNDKARRFIANDPSIETLRAYLLIAGLLDRSESEVAYIKSKKAKALKYALPTRAEVESALFEEAYQLILKTNPEWAEKENIA